MSLVSLYDEASLWMTPSGAKDGRLFSELPVPVYGPELVGNGGFDSGTGWSTPSGWQSVTEHYKGLMSLLYLLLKPELLF